MEFRLVYRGSLPSQPADEGKSHSARSPEKHAIRRCFHPQLRELWHKHAVLSRYTKDLPYPKEIHPPGTRSDKVNLIDFIAKDFTKFGYRFVPLINFRYGIACSLDILFLRRDEPGAVIWGGDIDNRIKVLFDGLRVPKYNSECESMPPQEGENPFFCLLEDDKLITDIKITTDRLLTPTEQDEQINDVHLILHVTTKVLNPQKAWPDFWV